MVSSTAKPINVEKPKRPNILARLGNLLLLLVLAGNLFGLIQFAMSRDAVKSLSDGVFDPNQAIMDSWFLDMFLNTSMAVFLGVILISLIAKEFYLKNFRLRVLVNIGVLIVLMVLNGLLVASYNSPIIKLGTMGNKEQPLK